MAAFPACASAANTPGLLATDIHIQKILFGEIINHLGK